MLGLLATPSIPLRTTVSTIEIIMAHDNVVIVHPTERQRQKALSTHVLGFDNCSRELVFVESWGEFSVEDWEEIVDVGGKERVVERLLRERVEEMLGVGEGIGRPTMLNGSFLIV